MSDPVICHTVVVSVMLGLCDVAVLAVVVTSCA